ncbi:MAG: HlyC/CorC family transporter [Candidatus Sericytochromatia bacterium]|nr:HlyC/CorC family transporter [Candidatus Sericytochromatia bacterium]
MTDFLPLFVIAGLIAVNGFFVAAEFAFIGLSRTTIEGMARKGNIIARRIRAIHQDPAKQDQVIATAQLGITFASLGLGMYGEKHLAEWAYGWLTWAGAARFAAAHLVASALAMAMLTYLHIVIGETVPKSLALQRPEQTALLITLPLLWFKTAAYPLVIGLNRLGNAILSLAGIDRQAGNEDQAHDSGELQLIIAESQREGLLRAEAGSVLKELFEFGARRAGEVMVPRVNVIGIPLGSSPRQMADFLRTSPHTRYPVYLGDLDHIVGMIHIKDLLRLQLANSPLTESDVRPIPYVPQTVTLDALLVILHRERTEAAVVMDEHGGTAGMVTVEDLFEEVAGDIDDSGVGRDKITLEPDGRLRVFGTVRLDELGEHLALILDHDLVDTVSGLILFYLNRPAKVGDVVHHHGLLFQVRTLDGRGVGTTFVSRMDKATG